MNEPSPVLSLGQIAALQEALRCWQIDVAAAMYRTDEFDRPYRAGRGEMYRLWNALGQALEILELFRTEQYPTEQS